jgi:hypothetical protein
MVIALFYLILHKKKRGARSKSHKGGTSRKCLPRPADFLFHMDEIHVDFIHVFTG